MHGIVSAFKYNFAPTVTADMVIRHAAAGGLANEIAPESMSGSAKVIIGVMSALTGVITLPLFIKLHNFIQQSYYAPEELKLLAQLGCKAATAQIVDNTQANERRVKIELGEKDDLYTTLYFIERRRTDGQEGTQCVVQDYTGAEVPCSEEFSSLEKVIEFYKEDVAEDKDEIYSQNVSKDLYIDSTLGVALHHYGSAEFDQHDLSNFKKLFGLSPDYFIELEELQDQNLNLTNRTNRSDADWLLKMIKSQLENSDHWDRDGTNHLLGMFYQGLSDGLLSVYQYIFTDETLKKYVSLADEIYSLCQTYRSKNPPPPVGIDFTRDILLHGNTKATLENYGYILYSSREFPFMKITIADRSEFLWIASVDQRSIRDMYLEDQNTYRENYKRIRELPPA